MNYADAKKINLVEVIKSYGFKVDKSLSSSENPESPKSSSSWILRAGDPTDTQKSEFKIGVSYLANECIFLYADNRKNGLGGSIIDWIIQNEKTVSGPRDALNFIISRFSQSSAVTKEKNKSITLKKDFIPYLFFKKGIPFEVLNSSRFKQTFSQDDRKNITFPIMINEKKIGESLRNVAFKGLSKGSKRGIWYSNILASDKHLAVFESAIDAMAAYHITPFLKENTAFCSTEGSLSKSQIKELLRTSKNYETVYLGFDNDDAGGMYESKLIDEIENVKRLLPPDGANDFCEITEQSI